MAASVENVRRNDVNAVQQTDRPIHCTTFWTLSIELLSCHVVIELPSAFNVAESCNQGLCVTFSPEDVDTQSCQARVYL